MKLSMSSIRHRARSAKPLADDLGFRPSKDMVFSWSGINLSVDLQIDPNGPENVENFGQISVADPTIVQDKDHPGNDGTEEPTSTHESGGLRHETDAIKDHLLLIDESDERDCQGDCHDQPTREEAGEVDEKCGAAAELSTNGTYSTWPEWGEPLPPEDFDDIEYTPDGGENPKLKKVVTFSDVITFIEPSSLEEDMKIGSLRSADSSAEESEQRTGQVSSSSDGNSSDLSPSAVSCSTENGILNSADVAAAYHLFDLGNAMHCGTSNAIDLKSAALCAKSKCDFYNPSHDLERLSELVEKIYAAVPQLSVLSNSQGSVSSEQVGFWTVEVSKDSARLRMKRLKLEKVAEFEGLGILDVDDDNEVLERPPWKRQYKFLGKLS